MCREEIASSCHGGMRLKLMIIRKGSCQKIFGKIGNIMKCHMWTAGGVRIKV